MNFVSLATEHSLTSYIFSMLDEHQPSIATAVWTGLFALGWFIHHNHSQRAAGGKQRPPTFGWPLIGRTWQFIFDLKAFQTTHDGLWRTRWLGMELVVVPTAEHAEEVFRGEGTIIAPNEGFLPSSIKRILGYNSMVSVTGHDHRLLRSSFVSCFGAAAIRTTSERVQSIAHRYFESFADGGTFDAVHGANKIAFESGASFVGLENIGMTERHKQENFQNMNSMMQALLSIPIDLGSYSAFGRGKIAAKEMQDVMEQAILARREHTKILEATGKTPPNDILQRLVELKDEQGRPVDMVTLKENMVFFVLAAFDTTAATLKSFFLCMCRHPDIQERAYKHIEEVLGAESDEFHGKSPIPYERFAEFDYIDQILLECGRFYPPIASVGFRRALKDFELGGYLIKKDTRILVDALVRSRNAAYWERPESFEPDRFGPLRNEHKTGIGRNWKLATFGGGSKQCIGKGFANFERKVIAILALRDYKFSLAGDGTEPTVKYAPALRIDGDFFVNVERRRS